MKIYISGKISGRQLGEAMHHFSINASCLRALGHETVNPFDIAPEEGLEWHEYMRADIKALCDCDAILMLFGWQDSRGAILEHHIAQELGMKILTENKQMDIEGL
jgi:hypothetical protein